MPIKCIANNQVPGRASINKNRAVFFTPPIMVYLLEKSFMGEALPLRLKACGRAGDSFLHRLQSIKNIFIILHP